MAVSWGTRGEIERVMRHHATEWVARRTALRTYANLHPSPEIRNLGLEVAEAIERAFSAASYLLEMQTTEESRNAFEQAQKTQDKAKDLANKLMDDIRNY
jgi:hypothetical protein